MASQPESRSRARSLGSALAPLLDLFFPPHCVACGALGAWFCKSCKAKIDIQRPPLCTLCGKPLPHADICYRCQHDPLPFNGLRSVAQHKAPLSQAIHALKYGGVRVLAKTMGSLMAEYLSDLELPVDTLIPVPLHRSRERQRGYNQSRLLADSLSEHLGVPVIEGLVRLRDTPAQVGLTRSQRIANVQGAFCATDACLRDKRILLIDDVCTTGATLTACANALAECGTRSIWALTLARAVDKPQHLKSH